MKMYKVCLSVLVGLSLASCKKADPEVDLPGPTGADFEMKKISISPDRYPLDQNYVVFKSTSGFISTWEFEGGNKTTSGKMTDTVYFARKGTYKIKLTSGSKGGYSTVTKDLVIEKDTEIPCDFTIDKVDEHHYKFKNTTPIFVSSLWSYGNGQTQTDAEGSTYFPWAGTWDVKLTAELVKGVFVSTTKQVTVAADDDSNPDLSDEMFTKLTGGVNDADGKTWRVDLPTASNTGVGPYKDDAMDVSYWNYPQGYDVAWTAGCGSNEYTFIMKGYQYKPKNQNVTVHYDWAVLDFGKAYTQYTDLALVDPRHKDAPFILKNEGVGITGYTLKFGDQSYLGYCDGRRNYEISKFSANADTVWIRHKYQDLNNDPTKNNPATDGNQRVMRFVKVR